MIVAPSGAENEEQFRTEERGRHYDHASFTIYNRLEVPCR